LLNNSYTMSTDYLKEDPPIVNQDWCVISIISPKDAVATKTLHYVNNFMVSDINSTIASQSMQMVKKLNVMTKQKFADAIAPLSSSLNDDDQRVATIIKSIADNAVINEDQFVHECRREYSIDEDELLARYKIYLSTNRQELDGEFDSLHGNMVSVRGIKNRGNYSKFADAEKRAQFVRGLEPAVHVFVAPVGKWCPVDFEADEIQDQDYMSAELNNLMSKYHENEDNKNLHFEQRKTEMITEARMNTNAVDIKDRLREKIADKANARKRQ
jgi:hypothetical protein